MSACSLPTMGRPAPSLKRRPSASLTTVCEPRAQLLGLGPLSEQAERSFITSEPHC